MISHEPENQAPTEGPPPTPPPAPMVFQGASACGPIGLALAPAAATTGAGAPTGAEQVLRLAQAEPLIRAVEQWLHGPWDPAPHAGAPVDGYRAVVRDPALAPPGTVLTLPLQALLAPPPDALRAPALRWAAHDATLVLADLPADALQNLQVGGLLWLPASFGSPWAVSLADPARQLPPCPAKLDLAAQRLTVTPAEHGAPTGAAAPEDALQVQLSRPVQLPLDHWLGWARAPFHWPVPPPWAAELRQGAVVRARGALLPMGAGCGLRVEALVQPETAA